ncbi:MAG: tryptophan 7-halogenase [Woeseiaceae bacterium]|nr:tryptophan 7-halogenase [Woeseiaceae bacterium]
MAGSCGSRPQRHDVVSLLYPGELLTSDAARSLLQQAGGDAATATEIRWRNGHRRSFWQGNCVALGTAAGMLEPLVFSPLHLLASGVGRLLRMFPDAAGASQVADEYNRATQLEFENARDYVLVNYAANRRDGSLWERGRKARMPDSFRRRRELFGSTGRVPAYDEETFDRSDWAVAWLAAGLRPEAHDPLLDRMPAAELDSHFARLQSAIAQAVGALPLHDEFIERLRLPQRAPGAG